MDGKGPKTASKGPDFQNKKSAVIDSMHQIDDTEIPRLMERTIFHEEENHCS